MRLSVKGIPKCYHKVICSIKRKAKRHNVELRFGLAKTVHVDDKDEDGCGGYFKHSRNKSELAVAIGSHVNCWLPVFIHESCHMDQQFDHFIKKKIDQWQIAYINYFEWLSGEKELTEAEIKKYTYEVMECERDCDERAVKKILKNKLPIDVEEYIQKSNTYIFGYIIFTEKRKWFNHLNNLNEIWRKAPNTFVDLNKFPKRLEKAIRNQIESSAHKIV